MTISNPSQFVSVPFEELKNLIEMARNVAKRSPFGTVDTQPWNPDMTVLPELGNSLPTVAGIVGETNTILIALPDLELIKRMLPTIGANGNWWVNGEDTGVSALADSNKIMRPQFLIRPPTVTGSELANVITVTGGVVTVDNGTDKVLEIPVQAATLDISGKVMAAVDTAGTIHLYDSNLPVAGHVPILYFTHKAGTVVDVPASVEIAMSAQELSYYVTVLRTLDADYFDAYKKYIESSIKQIEDLLASANAKLVGVPRFMTFCHINDYDYITPQEIGFMVADHSFSFKDNFAGSVARCRPKNSITVLPVDAIVAIWLEPANGVPTRIGSVQFNATTFVGTFIMYQQSVDVLTNDTVSFRVDIMEGVNSVSISLSHTLV